MVEKLTAGLVIAVVVIAVIIGARKVGLQTSAA